MKALYREEGTEAIVEVLVDQTQGRIRTVLLRCIETREADSTRRPGHQWIAYQMVGFEEQSGWTLTTGGES